MEDRSLELTREVLLLDVHAERVDVAAWFEFTPTGPVREHTMGFVIGEPAGSVSRFEAVLIHADGSTTPVASAPGAPTPLPMGPVGETRDLSLPAEAFERAGTWLVVRYAQTTDRRFSYVLRSGAYWAGNIRSLQVRVFDPSGRVVRAEVEGTVPERRANGELRWAFAEIEPRESIELTLR